MARSLVCVDTDVCVDYLRGIAPGHGHLERALAAFDLRMTAVTAYELLLGHLRIRPQQDLTGLFEVIPVVPFDQRSAECAAEVHATLSEQGRAIGLPDTLIAGTCLAGRLPLLTRNLAHYQRVEGLDVIDPATL